jgi:simple sugar transport system substrate-binding protein
MKIRLPASAGRVLRVAALIFVVLTTAFMTLSGCSGHEDVSKENAVILGFSQLGSESGWRIGNSRDIIAAADRAGVRLMFENAEQKQENQIKAIRSFIAYQVDVIAFAPIVEDGWTNVLTEARDAGIPVLCTDRFISVADENLIIGFVGSDFLQEGRRAGEFLVKKADQMGKDHLRIVEITGTVDSTPMRQRAIGFRNIIGSDPRFEIVASISGDFLKSKGKECMQSILKDQGLGIDVLYSHNDAMTLGAIEAIEDAGLTPGKDIVIITVDGEQGAIDLLKQGRINCVVECTPKIGDIIMSLSKKLAAGEKVDRYTYSEETVFTEFDENLQDIPARGY